MRLAPLPYRPDSAELFEAIRDQPWAVFLDSGRPATTAGRWDILAARPFATLLSRGGETRIEQGGRVVVSLADPLALLHDVLKASPVAPGGFPFVGGAIGYFGYDLARRIGAPGLCQDGCDEVPEMAVGIYDWAVLVDHHERVTYLVSAGRDARTSDDWEWLRDRFSMPQPATEAACSIIQAPRATLSWDAYLQAFRRVQGYIRAGDCYQVNLTLRYRARVRGDRWDLYRRLRRLNPAPFSAYLDLPGVQVLSTSPEGFLELRGDQVRTRPIKGTRPRDVDPVRDRRLADELAASVKDRAENLMIVDLLRNDLGKVCRIGSVQVPRLFAVESYANVHHLVSTVTGRLDHGRDAVDLLRACFPGGSITGAPKRRAMQIIDELEVDPRGVYCGAIGYLGFDGGMDTSIAIRTLVSSGEEIRFGVGGAIVADSLAEAEYQECRDKAAPLLRLFEAAGDAAAPA